MNDRELDELLKQAKTPERDPNYWETFPRSVTRNILRQARAQSGPSGWIGVWAWRLATAVGCVALGILWGWWHLPDDGLSSAEIERHRKVYREISGMFPDQVRAILIGEEGVRLELRETAGIPSSMPILVKTCNEAGCQIVISFSGEKIPFNGDEVELLLTSRNEVILVGAQDVWQSGGGREFFHGFRVQAKVMEVL